MSGDDHKTPLSPDERRQIERKEKDRLVKEAEARIVVERGPAIEMLVKAHGVDDPELLGAAVSETAKILVGKGVRSGNFEFRDHPGVIEQGIGRAETAIAEREKLLDARAQTEQAALAAKEAARPEPSVVAQQLKWNLGPGAVEIEVGGRPLEVHLVEQPEWVPTRPNVERQALHNAFHVAAIEVCGSTIIPPRPGGGGSLPPDNGSPMPPDSTPTPSAAAPANPPAPHVDAPWNKSKLNSDNILHRFGNSELEGDYQKVNEQSDDREAKLSALSLDPATRNAARISKSSFTDEGHEPDLMAIFSTATIKREAAEEEALRANDPSRTVGRGGRSR
jgi:hypothetical protein